MLSALQSGEGRMNACKIAGIEHTTLLRWEEKDADFADQVKKAEIQGNTKIKDIVKRRIIEDKSWQSAAWWLERNYPDEFAQRNPIQRHMVLNLNVDMEDDEFKRTGEELRRIAEEDGY